MTDAELIARLRGACYLAFDDWCLSTAPEAADRIEALVRELTASTEIGKAFEEDAGQQRARAARLTEALEAIYEITVEPAETNHKNVRGWIEVTARTALTQKDRTDGK